MIKSMTGYGYSSYEDDLMSLTVEIKSLNSKFLDLNLRLPRLFSDREMELRMLISERLERGKITVQIDYVRKGAAELRQTYNEDLFIRYYTEYKRLADRVMAPYDSLFQLALNAPEVIQNNLPEMASEEEYQKLKANLDKALKQCDDFRKTEGLGLEKEFIKLVSSISDELRKVHELDRSRLDKVRDKLRGQVASLFNDESFDRNRLEQELVYYAEKLDIREECVRLEAHLDYFLRTLKEHTSSGKKLSFIAQEIGREINTLGAKANDAAIQQVVVLMKEDLEKIKEQLANVL